MEVFLAEYGLSTEEGVALMCLAEALLRVPDADTVDALIEDKIAPSDWGAHLGQSSSPLVNASTWALMLTGRVLRRRGAGRRRHAARRGQAAGRAGDPHRRRRAMREMGRQFVLGEDIDAAMARAAAWRRRATPIPTTCWARRRDRGDARAIFDAYTGPSRGSQGARATATSANPGISVKLSALHPRYEEPSATASWPSWCRACAAGAAWRDAGIGLNIDAEEADRLDLSLDVIEAVARPGLAGWDGFGVVVQAYSQTRGVP
jgi:RHH-type proline utilization regulon transcriptional repressor/proline dehydrogenase/delta 1-pyrroline-5-carboxylate dehydrogenase